ncbi:DUF3817 domain-containing protein [Sphingobacterium spiritivorum]
MEMQLFVYKCTKSICKDVICQLLVKEKHSQIFVIKLVLLLKFEDIIMLRLFRQIALWEAISTILLFFFAMPLKYFADIPEAVRIAGSIHGFLVVIFVIMLIVCTVEYKWSVMKALKYFVVSLIPVASFWVELDLKKEIAKHAKGVA